MLLFLSITLVVVTGFACVHNDTSYMFHICSSLDTKARLPDVAPTLLPSICQYPASLTNANQIRLASVRVVEAVSVWREEVKAARLQSLSKSPAFAQNHDSPLLGAGSGNNNDSNSVVDKTGIPTDRKGEEENGSENREGCLYQEKESDAPKGYPIRGYTPNDEQMHVGLGKCMDNFESVQHSTPESRKEPNKKRTRDAEASGQGGRDAHGGDRGSTGTSNGKWVVTMMVPGHKLWGSSPAMMSQYKRFRRSRQDPRIARDQVCLCARTSALSRETFYEII